MCTRKLKNRSDHATFHDVFIHFEPDEKKEAKRRRLKNPSLPPWPPPVPTYEVAPQRLFNATICKMLRAQTQIKICAPCPHSGRSNNAIFLLTFFLVLSRKVPNRSEAINGFFGGLWCAFHFPPPTFPGLERRLWDYFHWPFYLPLV